ncbi:unnamed protein product [Closterium sp. NIES-54]
MEVARTSMIHAAAPHFLWLFVVWYATHQLNLWPRVSLPETSPTLRWTGKVGDASVIWVWDSRAFIRNTSADKLSSRAIPYVFLGFPPDSPGWQFYHPTTRCVLSSQDVTFDESVPFYRLFPYRTAPLPPPPFFLAPGPHPVDPLPPQGLAPSGVSQVAEPVEFTVDSGAARGVAYGGAEPAGAEPGGAQPASAEPGGAGLGGAEPEGAEPGGVEFEGADSGGVEPRGTASGGGAGGPAPGGTGAGGTGAGGARVGDLGARGVGAGGAGAGGPGAGDSGAGDTGAGDPGAGGAGARGVGAGGIGAGGPGAGGAGAGDPRAGGAGAGGAGAGGTCAGGTVQRRPFFVPMPPSSLPPPGSVLRPVLHLSSSTSLTPSLLCPPPHQSQPQLQPDSPLLAPSYTEQTDSLSERRELESRPSSVPLRVPLPSPTASSLADGPDLMSDFVHAASPTIPCLLATVVTDSSFESAAASTLVAELVEFAAARRLDYATSLLAESESECPPSVGGECALGTDVLEDRQEDFECLAAAVPHLVAMLLAPEGDPDAPDITTPRSYAEAITGPYSSQWQTAMDAKMASWKSTGTYVDAVSPPGANIVDGMWILRVKRPSGSPPVFKARYVARGFSQRQGVDFFHTFSPTPKMTTLRVLLHIAAQLDYKLHSLDFSTAFLEGSLHEEIWLRRPPGFTGSFPAGTQWSLRRPVYSLRQAPREWQDTLRTMLPALGFAPSTANPSLFLRTDTSLPPFYILVYVNNLVFATADTEALALVLQRFGFRYSSPLCTPLPTVHSLSAPPLDESVDPSGQYPELVGCLMYLMTSTRPDLAYPLSILARYVVPGRHRPEQ